MNTDNPVRKAMINHPIRATYKGYVLRGFWCRVNRDFKLCTFGKFKDTELHTITHKKNIKPFLEDLVNDMEKTIP